MEVKNNINISVAQLKLIKGLLKTFLPRTKVWAFGSRVGLTSRPESDLDLVAFTTASQKNNVDALKDAFAESDLPFRIDLLEWDNIPQKFKQIIEYNYMKLQDDPADP